MDTFVFSSLNNISHSHWETYWAREAVAVTQKDFSNVLISSFHLLIGLML